MNDNYQALYSQFQWQVPEHFNMADVCCRRWANQPYSQSRPAVVEHLDDNGYAEYSYDTLQKKANKLSHLLHSRGVQRGDRVAIVLPQRFETAVAYIACLQIGAVAMPLSMLFGEEALRFRLTDSGAVAAIADEHTIVALRAARVHCPLLATVVGVGFAEFAGDVGIGNGSAALPDTFNCVQTKASDPAVLIYTSGTTGNPKGALIPHRALIGNLTGFVCSQNWFGFDPQNAASTSAAIFWSPADWAWTGGLMDALLPTLYFGRPIIAYSGRFSPDTAFDILQLYGVTHSFLFPTALKAMMKAYPKPQAKFSLKLQALMSAGEAVGDAVFAYCQDQLGVTVNEMFGQTEINYIVGNCAMNGAPSKVGWPAKPGSMGRAYPGHRVAVIDDAGKPCPVGVAGAMWRFMPKIPTGSQIQSSFWVIGITPRLPKPNTPRTDGVELAIWPPWMLMATSGTRAAQTICLKRRVIGLVRLKLKTVWSSIQLWPMRLSYPNPILSAVR
jgi:acetyl-CoA synthetase